MTNKEAIEILNMVNCHTPLAQEVINLAINALKNEYNYRVGYMNGYQDGEKKNTLYEDINEFLINNPVSSLLEVVYSVLENRGINTPKAHWVGDNSLLGCSQCQTIYVNRNKTRFCPNCFADMREDNNND